MNNLSVVSSRKSASLSEGRVEKLRSLKSDFDNLRMLIRVEKDHNQKLELKARLLEVLDEFLRIIESASLTQRDGLLQF